MLRKLTCLTFLAAALAPVPADAQGLDWSHLTGPTSALSVEKTLDQCATTSVPATVSCTFNVVITASASGVWAPISISDVSSAWMSNVALTHGGTSQNCQEQYPNPSSYNSTLQVQIVTGALGCTLPSMALNVGDTVSFTVSADINLAQGHPYDDGEFQNCIVIEAENPASGVRAFDFSCVRFSSDIPPIENCWPAPDGMEFWAQFDSAISPSDLPNPGLTSPHSMNTNRQLVGSDLVDFGGNPHAGQYLQRSGTNSRVQYRRPNSGPSPFGMATHDFTIDFWLRVPAGVGGPFTVLDMRALPSAQNPNRGIAVLVTASGSIGIQISSGGASPTVQTWTSKRNIIDGDWHSIAVRVDRDDADGGKIWVDGASVQLTSGGYSFDPTAFNGVALGSRQTMVIGFDRVQQTEAPAFDIDEIEIFHRVLGHWELIHLASAPKCR